MDYSFYEFTDMLLVYGEARNNGRRAVRLSERKFANRRVPHHSTFNSVDRRLREMGNLLVTRKNAGRQRITRTVHVEGSILNRIFVKPSLSTRTIGRALNLGKSTVHEVLHEQLLYPYKINQVQALETSDYPVRRDLQTGS
nr:unnamed protein product [Callosobruchus analis]